MAKRHLTPKQIRAGFGGKRRKLAARKKESHRPRTKKRSNPPKKRRVAKKSSHRVRIRKRSATRKRSTAKRRNPVAEIISWTAGNPARRKKGKKSMARSKKRKKSSGARHRNAGRPKKHITRRRHRNPAGLGRPMDWVQGGLGVIGGAVGSRVLPQMILGAGNTGPMGYAANAVAALALGWGAQMFFKKPVLTAAVIAGGFGSLFARVIADKTPYGAQFSLSGLGDWGLGLYQKSNFNRPQHLVNGRPGTPGSSMFAFGPGTPYAGSLPSVVNAGADGTQNC